MDRINWGLDCSTSELAGESAGLEGGEEFGLDPGCGLNSSPYGDDGVNPGTERAERDSPVPVRLRRYDAADWPNPECHTECAYWSAVHARHDVHPDDDDTLLAAVAGPDQPWHPEAI